MPLLDEIQARILRRQYEFSKHAVDQSIIRKKVKETMMDAKVTYTLEHAGKFYIVERVPARVCKETGEQYFAPETVERIQALIKGNKKPDKVIQTPVYEYA